MDNLLYLVLLAIGGVVGVKLFNKHDKTTSEKAKEVSNLDGSGKSFVSNILRAKFRRRK